MNTAHPDSLREPVDHGDILTPYTFYHCMIPDNFQNLISHWHEEAEIAIIRDGCANYHISSETFTVKKGDLLFLSPNTLHSITEITGNTMISDTLVFHMNLLGTNTPDQCSLKYFVPLQKNLYHFVPIIHPYDDGYPYISSCMQDIMNCFLNTNDLSDLILKEKLYHLFLLLYQYRFIILDHDVSVPDISDEKMKSVLLYIQEHYKENIHIHDLASLCNFSEVHFMNLFKKITGSSCIEYINQYRLSMAAILLKSTTDTVLKIALECGYPNISYFNRQFKSKFHTTPVSYRKRINK